MTTRAILLHYAKRYAEESGASWKRWTFEVRLMGTIFALILVVVTAFTAVVALKLSWFLAVISAVAGSPACCLFWDQIKEAREYRLQAFGRWLELRQEALNAADEHRNHFES